MFVSIIICFISLSSDTYYLKLKKNNFRSVIMANTFVENCNLDKVSS